MAVEAVFHGESLNVLFCQFPELAFPRVYDVAVLPDGIRYDGLQDVPFDRIVPLVLIDVYQPYPKLFAFVRFAEIVFLSDFSDVVEIVTVEFDSDFLAWDVNVQFLSSEHRPVVPVHRKPKSLHEFDDVLLIA